MFEVSLNEGFLFVLADLEILIADFNVVFDDRIDVIEIDQVAVGTIDEFITRQLLFDFFQDPAGLINVVFAVVVDVVDVNLYVLDLV